MYEMMKTIFPDLFDPDDPNRSRTNQIWIGLTAFYIVNLIASLMILGLQTVLTLFGRTQSAMLSIGLWFVLLSLNIIFVAYMMLFTDQDRFVTGYLRSILFVVFCLPLFILWMYAFIFTVASFFVGLEALATNKFDGIMQLAISMVLGITTYGLSRAILFVMRQFEILPPKRSP